MRRARPGKLPLWVLGPWLVLAGMVAFLRPGESTSFGAALEGRLLDLRYQMRGALPAPDNIVIAALDDRTIEKLQRFPVPRDAIARAIDTLAKGGARTIAVDLLLSEPGADGTAETLAPADRMLAETLQGAPRVILAASVAPDRPPLQGVAQDIVRRNTFALVFGGASQGAAGAKPVGMMLPLVEFARSTTLGHVNMATDRDGSLNRIPLALRIDDGAYLPAIALEAVRQYLQLQRSDVILKPGRSVSLGARRLPTDALGRAMVNYYGGRDAFQTLSLIDIIDGTVPASRFSGRLVFIGSTALGFGDLFNTPFDKGLPGVTVHATLAANLLDGSLPLRDPETWAFDLALALAAATLAFLSANLRTPVVVFPACAVTGLLVAASLQVAFSKGGMWLDGVTQICVIVLVCATTLAGRFALQRKQTLVLARERKNLARYQSPLLADWLAGQANPGFGEHIRDAAVAFVDVADFTRRSEALGPHRTAEFLRELHALFERAVLPHGGVITQFMGDGAMIVFGLPQPAPDDAARGLLACRALLDQADELNDAWPAAGMPGVRLRVSLHYGPVAASVLGGAHQGQVSVSGDTVNVASRLQELAKQHKSQLIVSQQAMQSARQFLPSQALAGLTALQKQSLRGRKAQIDVWAWHNQDVVTANMFI